MRQVFLLSVDVIYVAASRRDSRFTRISIASIRYFYPDVIIRLLVGGQLQRGLADELRLYWAVELADFPRGDYGWGFVKLEPLFRTGDERFLVMDSDTAITGPILSRADGRDEDLVVDDENLTPTRARQIYYEYESSPGSGDCPPAPHFLFNTGQWFGRSGRVQRSDFDGLINWGWPPKLADPAVFKNGDQGVLNLVANKRVREGTLSVGRVPLMRWPGHGLDGLSAELIASRTAPPFVIHWAGIKKARMRDMPGSDILEYFERLYYDRLPGGESRRKLAGATHIIESQWGGIRTRLRLLRLKAIGRFSELLGGDVGVP